MRDALANLALLLITGAFVTVSVSIAVWRPTQPVEAPVVPNAEFEREALSVLGYVETAPVDNPDDPLVGVTIWDRDRAQTGLNLYNPRNSRWAVLVGMDGSELHRWSPESMGGPTWNAVKLLPGGDLLVIIKDHALVRIGWNSEIRWKKSIRAHHDLDVAPDGTIWAIARRDVMAVVDGVEVPILGDQVIQLDADGEILQTIDLWPHLINWVDPSRLERMRSYAEKKGWFEALRAAGPDDRIIRSNSPADFSHLNTIEILDREIPGFGRKGDLLLMPRNLNRVVVFDPVSGDIRWSWSGGGIQRPHHPTVLDDDHILLFDNGTRRQWSRVLELDPIGREIVWQYVGTDDEPFFSSTRGGSQRLPGGTTLITESNRGRAFEVTTDGEIVWEYYCPELVVDPGSNVLKRSTVFRLIRITDPAEYGLDELLG